MRIEMLERLAELRNSDLLSEEAVEDLKQRVLEDEFNVGVSGGTTQKAHRK
jgi:6-phosphogluconolactonase/glucosamine-6-phosphate isomerase/deaminase